MEKNPFESNFSREKSNDEKDKKKSRSKRSGFAAPLPIPKTEAGSPEKPVGQSGVDKFLAELAFKRREENAAKSKETEQPEKSEQPKHEAPKDIETEVSKVAGPSELEPDTSIDRSETRDDTTVEKEDDTDDDSESESRIPEGFDVDNNYAITAPERLSSHQIFEDGIVDLGTDDEQIINLRGRPAGPASAEVSDASADISEAVDPADVETDTVEPTPDIHHNAESASEAVPNATAASIETETPQETTNQGNTAETVVTPAPEAGQATSTPNSEAPTNPHSVYPEVEVATIDRADEAQRYFYEQQSQESAPGTSSGTTYVNPSERPVTRQELNDEVYYATKSAQRRGVIAGALVFGGYEHFKHKRREKRQTKRLREQEKLLHKEREQHSFQLAEQARQLNQSQELLKQHTAQAPAERLPKPPAKTEAIVAAASTVERQRSVQAQPVSVERPVARRFVGMEAGRREFAASRLRQGQAKTPEQGFAGKLEQLVPKRPERQLTSERAGANEPLEIAPNHHLETSAWHSIEVDSKTGKAVENPTFQYGDEYYRERAHEVSRRTDDQKIAAGEVALVAAAIAGSNAVASGGSTATDPSSVPTQAGRTSATIPQPAQKPVAASKGPASSLSHGPIWPYVVVFAVVVALLILAFK